MSERKAVIKNADMSDDMQQDAVECATQALEKYNIEKDIAAFIKKVVRDIHPIYEQSTRSVMEHGDYVFVAHRSLTRNITRPGTASWEGTSEAT